MRDHRDAALRPALEPSQKVSAQAQQASSPEVTDSMLGAVSL
jgi:hypothetical protein